MIDTVKSDTAKPAAAKPVIDVRVQQIAGTYAKAFLAAAQKAGKAEDRVTELEAFIAEVVDKIPQINTVFFSSFIKHEKRLTLIDRVLGGRVSPELLDFLKVLSQHDRLSILSAVAREVRSQYNTMLGRVTVQVRTAKPLSPADAEKLVPALRALLKGDPVIEVAVDPELIGGLVLRIGDTVYDGSVARQLEHMREQMINRSVHEIQSRRDSFRSTDGN